MTETSELASILDVPVLTTGTFQGHKGPPVEVSEDFLDKTIEGSNRLRPLIQEALQTGEFRGNPTALQRLQKPIPAPITLNHEVVGDDKVKEALRNVIVSFEKKLYNGKQWIHETFQNVPELAADIIRRFFTTASVELLNLADPETGEVWPTIISTAFLSNKQIAPAVPGQPGELLVEFASGEQEPCRILIHEPLIQGVTSMAEEITTTPVDVSELQEARDALTAKEQELAELQAKLKAAESLAEQEKAEKDQAEQELSELQAIKEEIRELKSRNETLESDELMSHLDRIRKIDGKLFQISKMYKDLVEPIIRKNGVIELAEGQNYRQAMAGIFDQIAERDGKILIPLATEGKKSYTRSDDTPKDFDEEVHELMAAEQLDLGTAIERVTAKHQQKED